MKLPHFYSVIELDSIDSTNLEAKRRIQAGLASDGTVITAKLQTGGRGRLERQWVSNEGNLFVSVIKNSNLSPKGEHANLTSDFYNISLIDSSINGYCSPALLPFATAIAIGKTLQEFIKPTPLYKWPNDVLVEDKKISGVLIETINNYFIIGVGINIANHPEFGINIPATCMNKHSLKKLKVHEVLIKFLENLDKTFNYTEQQIIAEWVKSAYGIGNNIIINQGENEISGLYTGIDVNGRLLLDTASSKREAILFGDVIFKNHEK